MQITTNAIYIYYMITEKKSLFASLASVCRVLETRSKSPVLRELAAAKRQEFEAEINAASGALCFSKRLDNEKKSEVEPCDE